MTLFSSAIKMADSPLIQRIGHKENAETKGFLVQPLASAGKDAFFAPPGWTRASFSQAY
jgi:hypothetical protein